MNTKIEVSGALPSIDSDVFWKIMDNELTRLGEEKFDSELADETSYLNKLAQVSRMNTIQSEFIKESLSRLTTGNVGCTCVVTGEPGEDGESTTIKIQNKSVATSQGDGSSVSGKQARYMVLAKGRSVKRFNLYNSGFFVVLRAPTLSEINLTYTQIEEDIDKYGKIFGAAFFMYSDLHIKQILWDFIFSLALDSNLKGWRNGDRLKKSVSFLDYNHLLLSIGQLMFSHGYPMTTACEDTECKLVSTTEIDLTELQLTDFSKLPEDKLSHMFNSEEVTHGEAISYQMYLSTRISLEGPVAGYRIIPKIPTMYEYLKFGDEFNSQLTTDIQDITVKKQLNEYLVFNYSRTYVPWIDSVEALNEDGEVQFRTSDYDVFSDVLNLIQADEGTPDVFRKMMNKYIQDSTVTLIGYVSSKCPSCKTEPSNAVNGFIPFDSQHHFFDLMAAKLLLSSSVLPKV